MTREELIAAHPTLQNMPLECEPPSGWVAIVHDAATQLEALGDIGVTVAQVKQKFGTLRIYVGVPKQVPDGIRAAVNEIVGRAELEAVDTCETCGASGAELHNLGGFWTTRCDSHLGR